MMHHLQSFGVAEDTDLVIAGGWFFKTCGSSLYLPGLTPKGAQNQTLKLKR